jgi:hypothetical protein
VRINQRVEAIVIFTGTYYLLGIAASTRRRISIKRTTSSVVLKAKKSLG